MFTFYLLYNLPFTVYINYNSSKIRIATRAVVQEALEGERRQVEAERIRQRELMQSNVGKVFLLVEHALLYASYMRCPDGHPVYKDSACNHMTCTAAGCTHVSFCYACGQGGHNCGCDQNGIYLHFMPEFQEATGGNGDAAVILFHFNRARAFVQVVKVMVLATPTLDDNSWTQLQLLHPDLLSNVHGNGNQLDWTQQQTPAELLQTFGDQNHKERRLRAQLTEFDLLLHEKAIEFGLVLPDFDEERLGFVTSLLLRDGTTVEIGVRVVAITASNGGNYFVGGTGVIVRIEPDNPVVRWDHNNEEHTSNKNNLNLTDMRLRDNVPAAVGMRVVAVGDSQSGSYSVGYTGVIRKLVRRNPIIYWDHSGQERESNRRKLNLSEMTLQDGTPAKCGVRVVAIIASERGNYDVGHTGVICKLQTGGQNGFGNNNNNGGGMGGGNGGGMFANNNNNGGGMFGGNMFANNNNNGGGMGGMGGGNGGGMNFQFGQVQPFGQMPPAQPFGQVVERHPIIRWDHSGREHPSGSVKLNLLNVVLQDGTPAAVGIRVVAIVASRDGNYDIGHTGVICSIHRLRVNPMVRWDHSGRKHQSSRTKLNVTNVVLQDGTPAAVGVRVVAIAASGHGNYAVGQTGVVCGIHENNTNPLVCWDHRTDQVQCNRRSLIGWEKKFNILHARNPSRYKISSDGAGQGWTLHSSFITHSTQVQGTRHLKISDALNPHRFKVSENGTGQGWTERADFFAHTMQVAGSVKFIISQARNPHRFKIGQVEGYGHGWEDVDHFFAFPVTNVVLQDGTRAASGVRVVAVTASNGGNYSVGDTGVIVRIELNNPVVRWDHSGEEHQSSHAKLNVTNVILQDGTPAAVGIRVVAIVASRDGNYDIGHTGVICSIHRLHANPMVRWDHSGREHQSSRTKLNAYT